jgi:DNA-binding protein HU-beta
MVRPAKITTPFPSVLETAKTLGVSKREAMVLSELAEHSQRTGVFEMAGLRRLNRVARKARKGRNPATGEAISIPAKKFIRFRVAKQAKDALVSSKKK